MSAVVSRSYPDALRKLAELQSNRAVTQLFGSAPGHTNTKARDLHAAAIPEVIRWLGRAGYSPDDLARMRHIHVAGTKGKGSVCAYATSLLRRHAHAHGPVGTYTSPHLVSPRERIAIDGEPISQERFAAAFFDLWDRFTDAARREGEDAAAAEGPRCKPFFFRFLTIMAWHVFLREGVRSVVMECGIGGEYDATNVLPARAVSAAVISQLAVDHVAMLGDTVEQIAWHKAGIFKAGVRAFTARAEPSVMMVLRERAADKGATLVELDPGDVEAWGGVDGRLKGRFQKMNQALAVLAVREHLGVGDGGRGLRDLPDDVVGGLREATLRGRCEVLRHGGRTWLLDGAHTRESLREVARWLRDSVEDGQGAVLVFNQQERRADELLAGFVHEVGQVVGRDVFKAAVFTRNEPKGAGDGDVSVQEGAAKTMRDLVPACDTAVFDNVEDAVLHARNLVRRMGNAKVLVTGSMHLVGGVLRVLEPDGQL
ncbi:Folylpolyglutamate synthetase [Metarhizium album ARSEF 1941]|uniref:Folylpolyglutamate synthase n=1 Tax=Metarhizium album (strain ARSEF 1941) TaxID=1081103 RepID=A0A0B2WUT6_METAS|nr:Folylpolyglutamate synthetase [Metarhizium album ARSEF 1941]KHN96710.1 Folylpolyglutamate synthetase [Metarhizium album ARSEF 1941]